MGRDIDVCGGNSDTRLRVRYSFNLGECVVGNRRCSGRASGHHGVCPNALLSLGHAVAATTQAAEALTRSALAKPASSVIRSRLRTVSTAPKALLHTRA